MVVTLVSAWAQIKTNVSLDQFIFIQKSEKKDLIVTAPSPTPFLTPPSPLLKNSIS